VQWLVLGDEDGQALAGGALSQFKKISYFFEFFFVLTLSSVMPSA